MRHYASEGGRPATGLEALRDQCGNEDLSRLVRNYYGAKQPTRKDQMLALLERMLQRESLRATWPALDPLIQAALAETAWSDDGLFDPARFKAKYGRLPPKDKPDQPAPNRPMYHVERERLRGASILEVLVPHGVMGRDVQKRLREFVPEPEPARVPTVESPPDHVELPLYLWDHKAGESRRQTEAVPLVRRDTERSAVRDLLAVLRVVDAGKVHVTDKNRWPTPGSMRAVAQVLDGGDYYETRPRKPKNAKGKGRNEIDESDDESDDKFDEADEGQAGPIRAFAWPMILQAGKMAHLSGSRLALTKAGRAALGAEPHETLHELWQKWLDADVLDELRRINAIRGQTGKGRRGMTDPPERRDAIAEALVNCPVGQWVSVEDFLKYLRAAGHEFEVTGAPWRLYISEARYGSLGDGDNWRILEFRYLLCFLMEYGGTLGLLDLAYVPPVRARDDYRGDWGTDDLTFLSRYDGLYYFRVNALGAYCLGLSEAYAPPPPEARRVLSVEPDLRVIATGDLSPADRMVLDTFAGLTAEGIWQLDRDKILAAAAGGRQPREIIQFLESSSGEPLPEPVEEFFDDVEGRLGAIADLGPARVIGCNDPALAAFIAADPATQKTCHRLNENLLVVPGKNEAAFFRGLRKLGYVLPPPRPLDPGANAG